MGTQRVDDISDSDLRLARLIAGHLSRTTAISDDVHVTVSEGQVELRGSVESFADRLMCTEVAQSLAAGATVLNELHVRPFDEGWQLGPAGPVLSPREGDPR